MTLTRSLNIIFTKDNNADIIKQEALEQQSHVLWSLFIFCPCLFNNVDIIDLGLLGGGPLDVYVLVGLVTLLVRLGMHGYQMG